MAERKTTSPDELGKLQAEIARLTKALSERDDQLEEARKEAMSAQALASLQQREIQEVPTGKMVKVQVCEKYKIVGYKDDGREIRQPVFREDEVPSYFYRIELPPSGGTGLKINGEEFMHGETYQIDLHLLRTVKDMVHRAWAHESNIKGSNENFYRRQTRTVLRGNAALTGVR